MQALCMEGHITAVVVRRGITAEVPEVPVTVEQVPEVPAIMEVPVMEAFAVPVVRMPQRVE